MRFLRTLLFVIILSYDYAYCQTQVDYCYDKSGSSESEEKIKASLFGTGLKIENFQILGSVCKYSDLEDFELGDSGVLLSTTDTTKKIIEADILKLYNSENSIIFDATIIEFDFEFEGGCDGLFFNYVFASEEYPEFVCSRFNDKFAFYIAEKNDTVNGYNNIATIPGTDISVAINSINGGECGSNYNKNKCESCYLKEYTDLFIDSCNIMNFNGRTRPLSASVKLDPNKEYHAYIIVADFVDSNYDSGVFFKEKGIFGRKCPTISVQCENGVSKLKVENESNNGQNSDSINSYQWLKDGQPIETGNTCIAQDKSTYSVNIKYESGYFINVVAPKERCCSANGEITINGEVVEGSLSVCKNKVMNIEYSHGNQLANPQYEWTFIDVSETDTFTSSNLSITAKKTGTVRLRLSSEECINTIELSKEILVDICIETACNDCPSKFSPKPGEKYVVGGWVNAPEQLKNSEITSFTGVYIEIRYSDGTSVLCYPKGNIIDGWQRISETILIPEDASKMTIALKNNSGEKAYFDDIRFHPFNASMKSYVYDPETLRLSAELDDENYATFYDYDEEGALVRVRKETERGVMTIQEARQSSVKIDSK